MLVAVRLHDHVELEWLRPGPGRFVEVREAAPPPGLAQGRRTLTLCEACAFVVLDLAEPVIWDRDRIDDELEDWLAL